jgi:hypothetical protein
VPEGVEMTELTEKEKKLVADLLEMAIDVFCNHGCNDLPDEILSDWSTEERIELDKKYHEYNGDPEEHDPVRPYIPDFAVMRYMVERIRGNV